MSTLEDDLIRLANKAPTVTTPRQFALKSKKANLIYADSSRT